MKKPKLLYALLIIILIVIDRLIKLWAQASIMKSGPVEVIPGVFSFTYKEASAGTFGVLLQATQYLGFAIIGVLLLLLISYIDLNDRRMKYFVTGTTLLLTGLGCNMIDIVFVGQIIDYLDFSVATFLPVINFADCISLTGIGIILFYMFFLAKKDVEENKRKDLEARNRDR